MNDSGVRWRGDGGVVRTGTGMVVCVSVCVVGDLIWLLGLGLRGVYIEGCQVIDKISIIGGFRLRTRYSPVG